MSRTILLLGGGNLVAATAEALAGEMPEGGDFRVAIASSDADRAEAICRSARRHGDRADAFSGHGAQWDNPDALAALFERVSPDCLLIATSLQSARTIQGDDAWSRLVRKSGYGVTLPLQLARFPAIAQALERAGLRPAIYNACFPDVANAAAVRLGLDVIGGIGNIALIADAARRLDPEIEGVLAGHVDLPFVGSETPPSFGPMLCWRAGRGPEPLFHAALPPMSEGPELYRRNALLTAQLLAAVVRGQSLERVDISGPRRLQGGYPARLVEGSMEIGELPGLDIEEARIWHAHRLPSDGAVLGDMTGDPRETVRFGPIAGRMLEDYLPHRAHGFHLDDLAAVVAEFVELRNVLENQ